MGNDVPRAVAWRRAPLYRRKKKRKKEKLKCCMTNNDGMEYYGRVLLPNVRVCCERLDSTHRVFSFFLSPIAPRPPIATRAREARDETFLVFARVDNAPGRQPGDVLLPRAPVARTHTYNARNTRHCTQTYTHSHKRKFITSEIRCEYRATAQPL